jgi:hypothetical protein
MAPVGVLAKLGTERLRKTDRFSVERKDFSFLENVQTGH